MAKIKKSEHINIFKKINPFLKESNIISLIPKYLLAKSRKKS